MQVSQQDQFITHAVVGNSESVSMGVSDDAALMHILSSTLYTYPQLAVVREIVCNAWDAHIAAGLTNKPIDVTITPDRITIRDYGFGISHANIGPIYGVYGNSTKRDDSASTGGFGLGSKAPFAYTDNFEVISHHLGLKTIYRVSKSSMEKGGKPSINKIVALPTDETGIAVSFDLKPNDHAKFSALLQEVLQMGEIRARLNEKEIELWLPMSDSPTGYLISDYKGTLTNRINLRYGNVVYPIPKHEAYDEEFSAILRAMENLWPNANVIFMAPPDSVSIAPSREALILTDATVDTIKAVLKKFRGANMNTIKKSAVQVSRANINKQIQEFDTPDLVRHIMGKRQLDVVRHLTINNTQRTFTEFRKAGLARTLEQGVRLDENVELVKKIKALIQRKEGDLPFLKKLVKVLMTPQSGYNRRKDIRALLARFVVYPLHKARKEFESLEGVRTLVYQIDGHYAGHMFKNHSEAFRESNYLNQFLVKKALIARNAKDAEEYLDSELSYKHASVLVWIVGNTKKTEQRTLDIIDLMSKLGYDTDMHLPEKEKVVREASAVTDEVKEPIKRRKKGTFYSLKHSYNPSNRGYLLSHARENYTDDTLIADPVAWTVLENKSGEYRSIESLSAKTSKMVLEQWGDQIAVVTSVQAAALQKKGIESVTKFLTKHIDDKLSATPEFKRYVAFAHHFEGNYRNVDKVLFAMSFHPKFMSEAGLRFGISADTALYIKICTDHYNKFDGYPKCSALLKTVKKHPKVDELKNKFTHHRVVDFIDLNSLATYLESYGEDAKEVQGAYEVIQLLLK